MIRRPPRSTRTDTLLPAATRFRSTQAMIPAKSRGRIRDLAGGWPVALDLLCAWSATTAGHCEGLSDLDIAGESRLGDFIVQDVLPLLTPGERTALVHASLLDTAATDIHSGIARPRDDGRTIPERKSAEGG